MWPLSDISEEDFANIVENFMETEVHIFLDSKGTTMVRMSLVGYMVDEHGDLLVMVKAGPNAQKIEGVHYSRVPMLFAKIAKLKSKEEI